MVLMIYHMTIDIINDSPKIAKRIGKELTRSLLTDISCSAVADEDSFIISCEPFVLKRKVNN